MRRGGSIGPSDLWVMSPASYRAAPPRVARTTLRHRPVKSKSALHGPAHNTRFRLVCGLFDIGLGREGFFQRLLQLVLRRAVGSEVTSLESFIRLRECVTRLGEGRS